MFVLIVTTSPTVVITVTTGVTAGDTSVTASVTVRVTAGVTAGVTSLTASVTDRVTAGVTAGVAIMLQLALQQASQLVLPL